MKNKGVNMKNIDKEAAKLIEELCQKEVERTGLPLVLDEDAIFVEDNTLYFHQKITFDLDGFSKSVLNNQNHLDFEDGKWQAGSDDNEFYAYELKLMRDHNHFTISLRLKNDLTIEKLIKRLSSDEFKEMFDEYIRANRRLSKTRDDLNIFVNRKWK